MLRSKKTKKMKQGVIWKEAGQNTIHGIDHKGQNWLIAKVYLLDIDWPIEQLIDHIKNGGKNFHYDLSVKSGSEYQYLCSSTDIYILKGEADYWSKL